MQMTNRLRDEAMTLYLAGHETTALTLTWSWYSCSRSTLKPKSDLPMNGSAFSAAEARERRIFPRSPTPVPSSTNQCGSIRPSTSSAERRRPISS